MFSSLSLASPLWVGGIVLAVGIPLAAHLLAKQKTIPVLFPSIRFIQQAATEGRNWLRLRDLLLLALRCLLLMLIVTACARPLWHTTHSPVAAEGMIHVLVLDRSASMQRGEGGQRPFDRAVQQLDQVLASLDPLSEKAVVVVTDVSPRSLLPTPSANFTQLRQQVRSLEPTFLRSDVEQAVRVGVQLALRHDSADPDGFDWHDDPWSRGASGRGRAAVEVMVFSDAQASTWPGDAALARAAEHRPVRVRQVGAADPNVALFDAAVSPTRPVQGQRVTVGASLANHGLSPRSVTVSLRHHDREALQSVHLPPGATTQVSFRLRVTEPGPQHVRLALRDHADAFAWDDRSTAYFQVSAARQVLMVTEASLTDDGAGAVRVAEALLPQVPASALAVDGTYRVVEDAPVALAVVRSDALAAALDAQAHQPDMVVIIEAGEVPAAARTLLARYVERGGGVWWVVDSQASAASLRAWVQGERSRALSPLVPADENAWQADLSPARTLRVEPSDDPAMWLLQEHAITAVAQVQMRARLRAMLSHDAQRLLSFDDGVPALATQWVGDGRVTVLAGDVSLARSNFAAMPAFVMLVNELVRQHAPGGAAPRQPRVGHEVVIPTMGNDQPWQLRSPAGQVVESGPRLRDEVAVGRRFHVPGAWEVVQDDRVVAGVHVAIDPQESDFAPVEQVEASASADALVMHGQAQQAGLPRQIELWPFLLAAAVVVGVIEYLLLMWWDRRDGRAIDATTWEAPLRA